MERSGGNFLTEINQDIRHDEKYNKKANNSFFLDQSTLKVDFPDEWKYDQRIYFVFLDTTSTNRSI